MTKDEIAQVVRQVMIEERRQLENDPDSIVFKTIQTILVSFGIEDEDRLAFKSDLQYLRRWRQSFEHVQKISIGAAVTILIGGFLGAVWLGLKIMVGK